VGVRDVLGPVFLTTGLAEPLATVLAHPEIRQNASPMVVDRSNAVETVVRALHDKQTFARSRAFLEFVRNSSSVRSER
jgi:hypothetical protein